MAYDMSAALRDGKMGIAGGLHKNVIDDLREIRYQISMDGRLMLEEKHAVRRRIGRSTDYADAVMLAWHGYDKAREHTPLERARKNLARGLARLSPAVSAGYGRF
jgi:hypothetical protein